MRTLQDASTLKAKAGPKQGACLLLHPTFLTVVGLPGSNLLACLMPCLCSCLSLQFAGEADQRTPAFFRSSRVALPEWLSHHLDVRRAALAGLVNLRRQLDRLCVRADRFFGPAKRTLAHWSDMQRNGFSAFGLHVFRGLAAPRGAFLSAACCEQHKAILARYDQNLDYLSTQANAQALLKTVAHETALLRRMHLLVATSFSNS